MPEIPADRDVIIKPDTVMASKIIAFGGAKYAGLTGSLDRAPAVERVKAQPSRSYKSKQQRASTSFSFTLRHASAALLVAVQA